MSARVLVVSWDGADREVVEGLLAQGRLPVLASLQDQGGLGAIQAQPGLADDAAWCSFATGLSPGVHGRFHHHQVRWGSYAARKVTREDVAHRPFWAGLAEAGCKVAIIDVPKSPLAGQRGCLEVADWMPHGADGRSAVVNGAGQESPAGFVADGSFKCHRMLRTKADHVEHWAAIRRRGELRTDRTVELLEQSHWDLFLTVIAETHCAGHHFWHLHDRSHPEHNTEFGVACGDPVVDAYLAADRSLGALIEAAGPDTQVIVFSPTGMGANNMADGVVDQALRRFDSSVAPRPWLRDMRARVRPTVHNDCARRLAWPVPHDAVSSPIRLNLVGREPAGRVQPGNEGDRSCAALEQVLEGLTDADTGRPVVQEIVRVDESYPGPESPRFADLLVVWGAQSLPPERLQSDHLGEFRTPRVRIRPGNHREGGWLVASGSRASSVVAIEDLGPLIVDAVGGSQL